MKKRLCALFMLILMVLGSFFFAFKPAAAQAGTTIYFLPDPSNVYLNGSNSQVVDIMIAGAVNLSSFDIILNYDASIANIQSVAYGSFFEIGSCLRSINNPGYLRYACIQQAKPPKSGGGVVLKLTFTGTHPGSTGIIFTQAIFSDKDDQLVLPTPTNGTLNVTYNATIKPSTLSGSFSLQGRTDRGGIPVRLSLGQFVGQGPYNASTTNVSGNNLSFTNVAMDVYTVSTAQAGYLNISPAMGKRIALLASGNTLPAQTLLGGNAIWTDNEINSLDLGLVTGEFGKTTFIDDADLNNNGKVDIFDLALVAGNYGLTSTKAYADWLP